MKKTKFYYFELGLVILITLGLYVFSTNFLLLHYIGFLDPVPLAVFIIRHKIKDGIFPAIFMILMGTLIGHFLPVGQGSFMRGFLFMIYAMTVGFLHGTISKTKINPLIEILIIIGVEIFYGFLLVIVFYVQKDPHFAYDIQFGQYLELFIKLFKIDETSNYAQNVGVIIKNGVIAYTIVFSFISVLLTHILIHLTRKFICREKMEHGPLHGLEFTISRVAAITYLVGCVVVLVLSFLLTKELNLLGISSINAIFTVFFSVTIIFVFQGILAVNLRLEAKGCNNLSTLVFISGILLSPVFAIIGAINPLLPRKEKAVV